MDWKTMSATLLPLLGVLLGTCGTLLGQYLGTRMDSKRLAYEKRMAERAERKSAILSFLEAAQRVEMILDGQSESGVSTVSPNTEEALHQLWLAKKGVELFCSPILAQNAHDYTRALHVNLKRSAGVIIDPTEKRLSRYRMMESARDDLGVTGDPLLREVSLRQIPEADDA
ncbi:hypothetical protein Sru01_24320 [Sphaerisporangium rufum]|uniref:Uncharacterized protein n=1 Tax=Sphaerisporangium rufum TaxID=1381558 RepID=A0A919R5A6_9ACTN|nr:hypothetical protein [Sphaerisporangium rufum]GII77450.1 hypothetical protein Sru01_24320 [Sphaerisporangium rufum]